MEVRVGALHARPGLPPFDAAKEAAMREYPPAHVIHEALCEDAPAGLPTFRAHLIPAVHPNARAHSCVSPATVQFDREVVAEPGEGRDHLYEPSAIRPDDATRSLCRYCAGTHGDVDVADWVRR